MKHAIGSTLIAAACLAAALVARAGDAAVQPGGTLPDTMIGTWGWDGDSCRRDDDGRVTVTAKSVTFFAASYDLRSIVEEGDGTIRATAIVHEEGEPETAQGTLRLKLVLERRLWILSDAGLDHVYSFCPQHP